MAKQQDEVADSVLVRYIDMKSLLRFAIEVSGIPLKDIAFQVGLHETQITRCFASNPNDNRHFPSELLEKLMDVIGNELPLRWLALRRGYGLHRLMSELERENLELRARLAEKDREHDTILKVLREIRA